MHNSEQNLTDLNLIKLNSIHFNSSLKADLRTTGEQGYSLEIVTIMLDEKEHKI